MEIMNFEDLRIYFENNLLISEKKKNKISEKLYDSIVLSAMCETGFSKTKVESYLLDLIERTFEKAKKRELIFNNNRELEEHILIESENLFEMVINHWLTIPFTHVNMFL